MATPQETAASFGYSEAFFRADPELSSLLDRATAENYTPQRFVAELQNTNWFRSNSESFRKWVALNATDPATATRQVQEMQQKFVALSAEMGGGISASEFDPLSRAAVAFGWSDATIRGAIAERLSQAGGHYGGGTAAAAEQQIRQTLSDYGVSMDEGNIGWQVRNIVLGNSNASAIKEYAMNQAASKYPSLRDRIWAGETVKQIADPYIQEQAKLLEINPESIGVEDPMIQQALSTTDKNGQPATKTIWQFQNDLRNDPRWLKTQNAQDSLLKSARGVLSDMGLAS